MIDSQSDPNIFGREYSRRIQYRRKYGMEPEEFDQLCIEQGFKCPICLKIKKRMVADHNHKTGKFRGAICQNCNTKVLPLLETHPEVLERARLYLKEHE